MSFALLGIGTAVPATRMTQQESADLAKVLSGCSPDQGEILDELYRQTEIAGRHIILAPTVFGDMLHRAETTGSGYLPSAPGDPGPSTAERMRLYRQEIGPLALAAARRALDDAALPPAAITHLVTVCCTGFDAPGFDIALIETLGLPPTVRRTHVGFMGCHGAFNGLAVARAFADADPSARVLVCAAEACSIHIHYAWNPKRMVGNALFADGAGAVVGAASTPADAWRIDAAGSCLFPASASAMSWAIGDHGFDMTLSAKVPALIAAHLRPWLLDWLAGHGLTLGDVASWAIHPGGPRILNSVGETLGLPRGTAGVSREVLRGFGNMSSATILFILERLRQRGAPRPCIALGFGPGLCAEAMLLR